MVKFDRDGLPIRAAKPSDRERSRSPPRRRDRDRSPPRGRDRSPPRRRTDDADGRAETSRRSDDDGRGGHSRRNDDDGRAGPSRRYDEPRGRDDAGSGRSRDEGRFASARREDDSRPPAPEVRYAEARPVVPAGMPAPASAMGGGARVTRMIEVIANDRLGGKGPSLLSTALTAQSASNAARTTPSAT